MGTLAHPWPHAGVRQGHRRAADEQRQPRGAAIIQYTAKTLYGVFNWGLMPQQAINLPNFGSMNGPTLLEEKRFPPATVEALRARGAEVREMNMTSGLQAITLGNAHGKKLWKGGADPRREGVVMGD